MKEIYCPKCANCNQLENYDPNCKCVCHTEVKEGNCAKCGSPYEKR